MGTTHNNQQRHDGQQNYAHSNERNRDHARKDTAKHHYAKHDDQTDDANFVEGQDLTGEMDFRDKKDNLETQTE